MHVCSPKSNKHALEQAGYVPTDGSDIDRAKTINETSVEGVEQEEQGETMERVVLEEGVAQAVILEDHGM